MSQTLVNQEKTEPNSYLSIEEIQQLFQSKNEEKYSKWALRTTRNWTNIQLVAIKAAISILLANTIWTEVRSLDRGVEFNWPRYLMMGILVIVLYFVYRFENVNNQIEDRREEEQNRREKSEVAQMLTIHYIFNDLLPKTTDPDKKLNILKVIPQMITFIDADQVTKEVAQGYKLVADVTTSIISKVDKVHEDVRNSMNLEKLIANITNVPRPRSSSKKLSMDDLVPSDDKFPR